FSSSRLLVFSSSRLLVFSSSRLLVFSSSRLHLVVRLDPELIQGLLEVSQDIVAIDVLFPDAFVKNVIQLS
ncbi:hypothetical protein, partial [Lactobacillus delbrueckii]